MSALFTHLMVPLDFTEKNQASIDVARDLALRDAARITLIHVVQAIDNDPDTDLASFYKLLREKAAKRMQAYSKPLAEAGLEVTEELLVGKPIVEIVRQVVHLKIDLLVLSSHPIDLTSAQTRWGTLSYQLSILCPCPALLVKKPIEGGVTCR